MMMMIKEFEGINKKRIKRLYNVIMILVHTKNPSWKRSTIFFEGNFNPHLNIIWDIFFNRDIFRTRLKGLTFCNSLKRACHHFDNKQKYRDPYPTEEYTTDQNRSLTQLRNYNDHKNRDTGETIKKLTS